MTDAAAEQLAQIAARRGGAMVIGLPEIAEEDEMVVRLFGALTTQWRVHPYSGQRLGIEFAAVPATAAMMGIDVTPSMFADLRIMEGAALVALAGR